MKIFISNENITLNNNMNFPSPHTSFNSPLQRLDLLILHSSIIGGAPTLR